MIVQHIIFESNLNQDRLNRLGVFNAKNPGQCRVQQLVIYNSFEN
jgi:hypothetical protein